MGPDQRFLGVLDTSPFRIAIVYSIVFACGAAALLGAVDFAVSRVVDGSTDNLIEAEVQGLREQMLVLSRGDFIELVEQRSQDQDVRGAVYLMVDPQLRPVAGNVPAWPNIEANQGKWFHFKVSVPFGEETREHEMRAQRFPLPGGYRMLVGHDVQERQDVKSLMMRGLIAAVVLTLLMGLGGGFWMGRRILAQAGAISAVATQIMRGDLSQRLPVRKADDEINSLAREINNMLDKIEQLTLGMRTVLDSAAHDLRTPLNRLQATAENAMPGLKPGSAERRVLERVTTEVEHMRSTLDALLRIALAESRHRGARAGQSFLWSWWPAWWNCTRRSAMSAALHCPVPSPRAPRCRAIGNCWRKPWPISSTMPLNSHRTVGTFGYSCKDRPANRRSWCRMTAQASPRTSASSCSAGECASMRRATYRGPAWDSRWWPRSRSCMARTWYWTMPGLARRSSLKF